LLRAREGHPVTPAGSLHPEREREMRLAGARRPEEDHVLLLGEEVALVQMQDRLAFEAAREGEVEVTRAS